MAAASNSSSSSAPVNIGLFDCDDGSSDGVSVASGHADGSSDGGGDEEVILRGSYSTPISFLASKFYYQIPTPVSL